MTGEVILDFDNPPIAEVVAAVKFKRLPDQALVHFGTLWQSQLAESFPQVQERPPYAAPIERFGREALASQLRVIVENQMPSPRLWFLNEAGDELLQLQRDWFACNWRKVDAGSSYSHWPARRATFNKWYSALDSYLTKVGLGPLVPEQCEVTYINHVHVGAVWKDHTELHKILRTVTSTSTSSAIDPEQTELKQAFVLHDDAGQPAGRLHVIAQPAFVNATQAPIYLLELTVRGAPIGSDIAAVIGFLDRGRDIIVTTFGEITTGEIQREWGIHEPPS